MAVEQHATGSSQLPSDDTQKKADKELLMQGAIFGAIVLLVVIGGIILS